MKAQLRLFVLFLVVVTTIVAGVIHGEMTSRWGVRSDMSAAAKLLEQVPEQCGRWEMDTAYTMSEGTLKMLRCAGYLSRQYVNQETGESVNVGIVYGPPGAISEHTPEVCFSTREFTQLGARGRVAVEREESAGEEAVVDCYWFADFERNGPSVGIVRTYWAWSTGGRWTAPDGPKGAFAGAAQLYKIQVSAPVRSGEAMAMPEAPKDPCGSFLKECVPIIQGYLAQESGRETIEEDTAQ